MLAPCRLGLGHMLLEKSRVKCIDGHRVSSDLADGETAPVVAAWQPSQTPPTVAKKSNNIQVFSGNGLNLKAGRNRAADCELGQRAFLTQLQQDLERLLHVRMIATPPMCLPRFELVVSNWLCRTGCVELVVSN